MLKIKDDVDLKELKKFEFYKSGGVYQIDLQTDWYREAPLGFIVSCIYIQEDNRIIRFSAHEKNETTKIDTLYDLIQAGLVEKVKEE